MTETAGAVLTAEVGLQAGPLVVVRPAMAHPAMAHPARGGRRDRTRPVQAEPVVLRVGASRGSVTPGRPTGIDRRVVIDRAATVLGRLAMAHVRPVTASAPGARGRLATMLALRAMGRVRLATAPGRPARAPGRPATESAPGARVRLEAAAIVRRDRGRIDRLRAVAPRSGPIRRDRPEGMARRVRPAVVTAATIVAVTTAASRSVRAAIVVLALIAVLGPTVPVGPRAAAVPIAAPVPGATRATTAASGRIAIR